MASPEAVPPDYESLLQFLYVAPVGLMQTGLDGEIVLINPLAANLLLPLQRTTQRLSNLFAALELVAPELRNMVENFSPARGEICRGFRIQVSAGGAGGNELNVLEISLIKLGSGQLMAVLSDVSAIVRREQIVRHGAAWLSAIVSGAIDYAAVRLSAQGLISSWDPELEKLTGHTDAQVLGRSFAMLFADTAQVRERADDYLWEARESGWSLREAQCLRSDGSAFDTCSLIATAGKFDAVRLPAAIAFGEPHQFVLIIRDLSRRTGAAQDVVQAAITDYLTGVRNRRSFYEAAELELKRWQRMPRALSVVVIDADHFKKINDGFGHAAGDAVLRSLAKTLSGQTREIDVVARIGGEEFALLLPGLGESQAIELGERIRSQVAAQELTVDGDTIRVTVSIGVASMSPGISGVDELIKRADRAMYQAKNNGRNCVVSLA